MATEIGAQYTKAFGHKNWTSEGRSGTSRNSRGKAIARRKVPGYLNRDKGPNVDSTKARSVAGF